MDLYNNFTVGLLEIPFCCCFVFIFWDSVSPCSPGCPGWPWTQKPTYLYFPLLRLKAFALPGLAMGGTLRQGLAFITERNFATETIAENLNKSKCRGTRNSVVSSPKWCISNTIPAPNLRSSREKGRKDCESPGNRNSAVRVFPRNIREATPMKSHHLGSLSKTRTRKTLIDRLTGKGEMSRDPKLRQKRQLRNANSKRNSLPQGRGIQLVIQWVVSPKIMYIQITVYGLRKLYLYLYI